jgi:hypothetical protein
MPRARQALTATRKRGVARKIGWLPSVLLFLVLAGAVKTVFGQTTRNNYMRLPVSVLLYCIVLSAFLFRVVLDGTSVASGQLWIGTIFRQL